MSMILKISFFYNTNLVKQSNLANLFFSFRINSYILSKITDTLFHCNLLNYKVIDITLQFQLNIVSAYYNIKQFFRDKVYDNLFLKSLSLLKCMNM